MKVGQLVTYTGDSPSLRGRVGVITRLIGGLHPMAAVDFGKTDENIIRCYRVNLTSREGETK